MSATYAIVFSDRARKDVAKLTPKLRAKLQDILANVFAVDPQRGKRLVGGLKGYWSYRLTYKDRILYRVFEDQRMVFIDRARTHYGD